MNSVTDDTEQMLLTWQIFTPTGEETWKVAHSGKAVNEPDSAIDETIDGLTDALLLNSGDKAVAVVLLTRTPGSPPVGLELVGLALRDPKTNAHDVIVPGLTRPEQNTLARMLGNRSSGKGRGDDPNAA